MTKSEYMPLVIETAKAYGRYVQSYRDDYSPRKQREAYFTYKGLESACQVLGIMNILKDYMKNNSSWHFSYVRKTRNENPIESE